MESSHVSGVCLQGGGVAVRFINVCTQNATGSFVCTKQGGTVTITSSSIYGNAATYVRVMHKISH